MITQQQFVKIIAKLKAADDLQNGIDELMQKSEDNIKNDFMNASSLQICHEDTVIELLEDMFDDVGEWICYWVYELDYGKKYTKGCAGVDDKPIDISTSEKLYDFLISEMGGAEMTAKEFLEVLKNKCESHRYCEDCNISEECENNSMGVPKCWDVDKMLKIPEQLKESES